MIKNRTTQLSKFYQGFFKALPFVAASPYLGAVAAGGCVINIFDDSDGGLNGEGNFIRNGVAPCAILTFFPPILPLFTLLTIALALTGFVIAGLSALIAYPVGMALDLYDSMAEKSLAG